MISFQRTKKRFQIPKYKLDSYILLTHKKAMDAWGIAGSSLAHLRWRREWQQKTNFSTRENLAIAFLTSFLLNAGTPLLFKLDSHPFVRSCIKVSRTLSVNKVTRIRTWPLIFCFLWNQHSRVVYIPLRFPLFLASLPSITWSTPNTWSSLRSEHLWQNSVVWWLKPGFDFL